MSRNFVVPRAQCRSELDPNKDKVLSDWSKNKPTYEQLEKLLLQAKKELMTLAEVRGELKDLKRELKIQRDRNAALAEQLKTIEMKWAENIALNAMIRAAASMPKSRSKTIKRKNGE